MSGPLLSQGAAIPKLGDWVMGNHHLGIPQRNLALFHVQVVLEAKGEGFGGQGPKGFLFRGPTPVTMIFLYVMHRSKGDFRSPLWS